MTDETTHSSSASVTDTGGAWLLPVVGSGILALLWGAYTLTVVAHIVMIPLPAL